MIFEIVLQNTKYITTDEVIKEMLNSVIKSNEMLGIVMRNLTLFLMFKV